MPPSPPADPVYARALEDLWSQVGTPQGTISEQPMQLQVETYQQNNAMANQNWQVGVDYPPGPTPPTQTTTIANSFSAPAWQQGQTLQTYPSASAPAPALPPVPPSPQQTDGFKPISADSERTNHSRANGSTYSGDTQPHSNVHAQTKIAYQQAVPVAYSAHLEEHSENGFSDMPFGSGALPPGSNRNLGQNIAASHAKQSRSSEAPPPPAQQPVVPRHEQHRPINREQSAQIAGPDTRKRQPNQNPATDTQRRSGAPQAVPAIVATGADNGVSNSRNKSAGDSRNASDSGNGRKQSRLPMYMAVCILLVLLAGGGAVAILYFFTDVFNNNDVSDVVDSLPPTLSPSPALTPSQATLTPTPEESFESVALTPPQASIAPTSEDTTESTSETADGGTTFTIIPNSDLTLVPTFEESTNNNAELSLQPTQEDSFPDADEATIFPTPLVVHSTAPSNTSTEVNVFPVSSKPENSSSAETTYSSLTNTNSAKAFVWQPMDQKVGSEPGSMAGSFLATNRNGTILVVGPSPSSEQPSIVYKVEENTASSLQLGSSLLPTTNTSAFVSAATNAEGTTIVFGVNDGSVQIYDYDDIENDWVQRGEDLLLAWGRLPEASVSVALSATGRLLVVGVLNTDNGVLSVQPYVYLSSNNSWSPIGEEIKRNGRRLSASVAISANGFIMAFTHVYMLEEKSRGSVETYELNAFGTSSTTEIGSFTLLGVSDVSVALSSSGGTMVVTSDKLSTVYGYLPELESWEDQPGGSLLKGGSTVAVDLSGTVLVIGDPAVVITYEYRDSWWRFHLSERRNLELVGEAGEGFGSSLALSGDGSMLAVGAPLNDDGGEDAGKVSLFEAIY